MITAVVLTKNEEKNIIDCLDGLKWCDEIIVIDDNSTDRTLELLEKRKVRLIKASLNHNFSKQRNLGIEEARGDWVFFVDADERVSDSLGYEIQSLVSNPLNPYNGFTLKRIDVMWGRELKHGETASLNFLRLARKDSGIWEGAVHEQWKIKGKIGKLKNSLKHFPHQAIGLFLKEINFYTDIRSRQLYEAGAKVNAFSIIFYPKAKFILNFFIRGGFLDGIEGLVFAIIMSFHENY